MSVLNSAPVKAATQNMSIQLRGVSKDMLSKIFDATQTSIHCLTDETNHKGYDRYHVIKRTGHMIDKKGELTSIPEKDEVVTIAGSRYQLAQHKEIFDNVINVLNENSIDFSIPKLYVDQREGRNRIYANLLFNDVKVDVDGSDISPTVDIFNSTDGGLAAGILFGAFRFKCDNGMLIGTQYDMKKIIHTPSLLTKLNFQEVFEDVRKEFKDLAISIEKMQEIKFKQTMLLTLQKMGFENTFIKNYPVIVEKYILNKNEIVNQDTLWGLYATATNFISNYLMLKEYANAIKHQQILHKFKANILK